MIAWLGQSVRRKLMFALVGIFFVTYGLTVLVILTSVRQSLQESEAGALVQVANQKLGRVTAYFDALAINIGAWARLEVMNDIFSGDIDKRISRTLAEVHGQYGLAGDVFVFDRAGVLMAASSSAPDHTLLPDGWASPVGVRFIGKQQNPLDKNTKQANDVVALSAPIKAQFAGGDQIGTLVAVVPWHTIAEMMSDDGLSAVLVDDDSRAPLMASHVPLPTIMPPRAGKAPATVVINGEAYLTGQSDAVGSSLTGWAVVAVKSESAISASLQNVARQLLVLGLALFIPISLGILWMAARLTNPVNALERTVSEISRASDLSLRADITTDDEIGRLAGAFNKMAYSLEITSHEREDVLQRLESLNITLENKVEQRTAALSEANTSLQDAFEKLKTTQSQLVQSEKMASLGQLVAGVAHELNNPISFIYANYPHIEEYADEILRLLDEIRTIPMSGETSAAIDAKIAAHDLDLMRDDLKKIISSGKAGVSRIKDIVLALRSFSRLDESEMKQVLLERGLDDTLAILHHYLKAGIEVDRQYELNEPVDCHPGQINQVFTNIIFNAIQAMGQKGRLTVHTMRRDKYAVVELTDNGPGIPPDIIKRIFDPFFTTKKVGEGTGLGLSISYGIIEKHNGKLEVDSILGQGTHFTISLPLKVETKPNDNAI